MNRHPALSIEDISQDDARHVLFYFNKDHGWQPGSFTQKLLELLSIADGFNYAKLAKAFPGLVAAHYLAENERNGIEILQGISMSTLSAGNVVTAAEAITRSGL
jgi:hypothetical protein